MSQPILIRSPRANSEAEYNDSVGLPPGRISLPQTRSGGPFPVMPRKRESINPSFPCPAFWAGGSRHMGREVVVAITEGELDCGHGEQIFYGEFDGGRRKRVLVKIIGE
jgi:hypothetical protein